jgi:hypothetical protein
MTRDEKIKKVQAYLTGERPTLFAVLKPDFSVSYQGERHEFRSKDLAEAHLRKLEKSYNVVKINVTYSKQEIARRERDIDFS